MICPKCGSDNVQAVAIQKSRGCGMILLHIILTLCTGGIWLILLLIMGKKSNTNFVCMVCSKQWNV